MRNSRFLQRRIVDELVDLKKEISSIIKAVPSPELQTLLEKRYLCFQSWEIIAVDMGYSCLLYTS